MISLLKIKQNKKRLKTKLNNLAIKVKLISTKEYNFFLGRMSFAGEDDLHN